MNKQFLNALIKMLTTTAATQSLLVEKGIFTKEEVVARETEMRDKLKQAVFDEIFGTDDARKFI